MNKCKFRLVIATVLCFIFMTACGAADDGEIVLRVSNWEEYMDEGEWDEEEYIYLDNGVEITPENSMITDFEEWYYETYGQKIKVEYSTFGTNEEMYNQITIGDVYDVMCPSEYMIMKMMSEDMLEPFSEDFYDSGRENNFYAKGVSPYIRDQFNALTYDGRKISDYAAGYMWGTLGIVYNPEFVSEEEAKHWDILLNKDYYRQITIKDSVRDAFFAGAAIVNYDQITSPDFINSPDYHENLSKILNATDIVTANKVEKVLSQAQKNVYSFETDAGKADLVSGKVYANQQWSGDAVYTMDQADEDDVVLYYSNPEEATNLWFDGWCMLKKGINEDPRKKQAAEAFINFVSRPDNAVRNMYYIGYTSVVSGAEDDDTILDYVRYNYSAEEDCEEVTDYDISYFFGRDAVIEAEPEMVKRQLGAQYPEKSVTDRAVIMAYFSKEGNARINRMWTNVRCFDFENMFN